MTEATPPTDQPNPTGEATAEGLTSETSKWPPLSSGPFASGRLAISATDDYPYLVRGEELSMLDVVLCALDAELDVPPLTAPQAQGDVIVLPWLPSTAPAWRWQEIDAATPIPDPGVTVDPARAPSHLLLAEPGRSRPAYHRTGRGHAAGTLVVPPGAAARLSHHQHGDLLIGPGVYVLNIQRRWTPTGTAPAGD